jgi:hypothetical protein
MYISPKYYSGDRVKVPETDWERGTYERQGKVQNFGRTIKETDFMMDPGVEVRITLKIS